MSRPLPLSALPRAGSLRRALIVALAVVATCLAVPATSSALAMTGQSVVAIQQGEMIAAKNLNNVLWIRHLRNGAWEPWKSLGASIKGTPKIVSWGPNHADIFVRGTDDRVYHKRWSGGDNWSNYNVIGSFQATSDITAVSWSAGRIDVFARGTDGALIHTFLSGGAFSEWEHMGGYIVGNPTAVSWYPGHLDVYVRGGDDRLYRNFYANGAWSGYGIVGDYNISSDPVATTWENGRTDVWARGYDGALVQTFFAGGNYYGWGHLGGGIVGAPSVVTWGPGHLDIFVRGTDNRLHHRSYGWSTGWSGWQGLGDWTFDDGPATASWGSGHIEVQTGSGAQLNHIFFAGGNWSGWDTLGVAEHSFLSDGAQCNRAPNWNAGSILGISLGMGSNVTNTAYDGPRRKAFNDVSSCIARIIDGRGNMAVRIQMRIDAMRANGQAELNALKNLLSIWPPNAVPIISLMPSTFEKCQGRAQAVSYFAPGQQLAACQYPTGNVYQELFREVWNAANNTVGNRVLFSPWNEPDEEAFVLRHIQGYPSWIMQQVPTSTNATQEADNKAKRARMMGAFQAGNFWRIARSVTNDSNRLLAGELASKGPDSLVVDAYARGASNQVIAKLSAWGDGPKWAYHPYGDMNFGSPGQFQLTVNMLNEFPSARELWLTEIGVRANQVTDREATRQYGQGLRDQLGLGTRAARALLYHPSTLDVNDWDSGLVDDLGRARPVICGLASLPIQRCGGNTAFGGDPN